MSEIQNYPRKKALEFRFPKELKDQELIFTEMKNCENIAEEIDQLDNIPSITNVDAAINYLSTYKRSNKNYGVKMPDGSLLSLEILIKIKDIHFILNLQKEVSEEDEWLKQLRSENFPFTQKNYELLQYANLFVDMIQTEADNTEKDFLNNRVHTLKLLVGNRWLSNSFLSWVANSLNNQSKDSFCFLHMDEYRNGNWNTKFVERLVRFTSLKRIIMFNNISNHYSLCVYDFQKKKGYFCDSLGKKPPNNLKTQLNELFVLLKIKQSNLFIVNVHGNENMPFTDHKCVKEKCSMFYPLQRCNSVCGVCITIVATLATFRYDLFELICCDIQISEDIEKISYLRNITKYSCFLRMIIMKWCLENFIDVQEVILNQKDNAENELVDNKKLVQLSEKK